MQDINKHAPVYSIGVVKNMTDLSKRQIRYYEETELVIPDRTSGNQRLYSLADVEKLLRIKKLLERGLNIEDVRDHLERREDREVEQNTLSHLKKLAASSDLDANFRQELKSLSPPRKPVSEQTTDHSENELESRPPMEIPRNLTSLYPIKNRPSLLETLNKNQQEEKTKTDEDDEDDYQ